MARLVGLSFLLDFSSILLDRDVIINHYLNRLSQVEEIEQEHTVFIVFLVLEYLFNSFFLFCYSCCCSKHPAVTKFTLDYSRRADSVSSPKARGCFNLSRSCKIFEFFIERFDLIFLSIFYIVGPV
tara:strand:+ start:316 stop:693 length:378 start_codon:yes stop_codon:yes gene_type:complete